MTQRNRPRRKPARPADPKKGGTEQPERSAAVTNQPAAGERDAQASRAAGRRPSKRRVGPAAEPARARDSAQPPAERSAPAPVPEPGPESDAEPARRPAADRPAADSRAKLARSRAVRGAPPPADRVESSAELRTNLIEQASVGESRAGQLAEEAAGASETARAGEEAARAAEEDAPAAAAREPGGGPLASERARAAAERDSAAAPVSAREPRTGERATDAADDLPVDERLTLPVPGKPSPAERPRSSNHREPSGSALLANVEAQECALGRSELPGEEDIWSGEAASTGMAFETAAAAIAGAAESSSDLAARLTRGSAGGGDRLREAAAFGSSQSLLSTDYYFRQYGAHGMRSLAAEVDDFGFDPHVDQKVRPLLELLCKRYFRVELAGAEHVPEHGRALLVANRAGTLPWDGLILRTALRALRPNLPPLRWLSEDSVIHYPFMGVLMNRLGAVRACPENAERLLSQDRLVAVFPEGAQGSRKLFRDRYRLQRFGRGGYVKLALKFDVPILPTAIIGAEETNPLLGRSRVLGRMVGREALPITPTFPWLGAAGLLPAPVKWRLVIGEPVDLSNYGPESADDALVVHRLNEQIRSSLQALVDQGKRARGSALFG